MTLQLIYSTSDLPRNRQNPRHKQCGVVVCDDVASIATRHQTWAMAQVECSFRQPGCLTSHNDTSSFAMHVVIFGRFITTCLVELLLVQLFLRICAAWTINSQSRIYLQSLALCYWSVLQCLDDATCRYWGQCGKPSRLMHNVVMTSLAYSRVNK